MGRPRTLSSKFPVNGGLVQIENVKNRLRVFYYRERHGATTAEINRVSMERPNNVFFLIKKSWTRNNDDEYEP